MILLGGVVGTVVIALAILSHLDRSVLLHLLRLVVESPGLTASSLVEQYDVRYGVGRRRADLVRWRVLMPDGTLTRRGRLVYGLLCLIGAPGTRRRHAWSVVLLCAALLFELLLLVLYLTTPTR